MSRLALSLLLLGAMAPAAYAEGTRSLGVTVSPGAFAVTRVRSGVVAGPSGSLDWDFRKKGDWTSMGGHVASSTLFTEATPLRVRVGPPGERVQPYVGFGASFIIPFTPHENVPRDAPGLRVGGEVSAGIGVKLMEGLFFAGEGRYQNFSAEADPLSLSRQELLSAYLGVGFRL